MMQRRRRNNRRGNKKDARQQGENPSVEDSTQEEAVDAVPDVPMQWQRMIGYLRPYIGLLLIAVVAMIIGAVLSLVFPAVIQRVVDSVLTQRDFGLLDQVTIFLIVIFIIRSFTTLIETYTLSYIGEKIVLDLRSQVYAHLQSMSLYFFTQRRTGELISRISSDVTVMRGTLTDNVNVLLQQTLIMIGSIIVMLVLNWRLTLFIIALIPIIVLVGFTVGYYLQRISTRVQDELAGATVVAEEVIQGIHEVKTFVREPYEITRYNGAIQRAFTASLKLLRVRSVFGSTMAFLGFGSLAVILWFGGREVLADRLTGGQLIAFLVYGLSVAGSFASLVGLYTELQAAIGATKRVFQILDTQPGIVDRPDAQTLTTAKGGITFADVSFSYDGKQDVLNAINLDIAPGEVIALVGPSGAGKSTMFNLIPRFYDPTQGQVLLDGIDLRALTQASLREQIAIVPQETLLFGGSIYENIRYGRLTATDEEIFAAAKAANAHEFILETTDGYQTVVGERGVRLSGGQRQRIAIARALLKDPRILLLDEATSSLDSESEHLVQEALARLMQGRTTIIIAHRLSTVRVADRIAVLKKGALVELGTHDELLTQGGLYAKLYEMQFGEDLLAESR